MESRETSEGRGDEDTDQPVEQKGTQAASDEPAGAEKEDREEEPAAEAERAESEPQAEDKARESINKAFE